MTKLEIEFADEGFYVPIVQTRNPIGELPLLRTVEDWGVALGLIVVDLHLVLFVVFYTVSHWGKM